MLFENRLFYAVIYFCSSYIATGIVMVLTPYQSVISLPIRFCIMRHSHNIRGLTNKGTQHLRLVVIRKCLFHRICLSKNTGPSYPLS